MSYADDYEATWDESNVKKFLNNEFYNSAFSLEEQSLIIGDVRLLTREEVLELFWSRNDRKCAPTKYLIDKGVYVSNENSLYYWIMSSGDVYYNMLVNADGSLNKIGLPKKLVNVIRPVILIKK